MARVVHLSAADRAEVFDCALREHPDMAFCHVDHSHASSTDESFLKAAYQAPDLRPKLFSLARAGFMAYVLRNGVTSFVRHDAIRNLWIPVKEGAYSIDANDVVYTYSAPALATAAPGMVVVFSSIAPTSLAAPLARHFFQNFPSLQKYVPPDCGILRIADLGGVTGAYYMNTHARPENELHIQGLIRNILTAHGVPMDRVVLYGTSKGGTGALLHALLGGYHAVAVDPIVSDTHYIQKHRDLHLVQDIFPVEKSERFSRLFAAVPREQTPRLSIITSRRSPQFSYMSDVLGAGWSEKAAVFDIDNPAIRDHPDVGPNSVHIAVMLMNMFLNRLHAPPGLRAVA